MTSSDDGSSRKVSRKHRKRDKSSKKDSSIKRKKDDKKKRRRDRSPSSDEDDSYEERKRRKKSMKHSHEDRGESSKKLERNYELADSLCHLFDRHPALASDLPIMLIRIAGGTTFELSQMTNVSAANGLSKVFHCLQPFGVKQDANGAWFWEGPPGGSKKQNELVLVRVIRTMLDQIGISIDGIDRYENGDQTDNAVQVQVPAAEAKLQKPSVIKAVESSQVQGLTLDLLKQFTNGDLAKELVQLCQLITEGESIALDSLPDERLRDGLESLFVECGLEKSEMENDDNDDSDDDDDDDAPSMGYGLPVSNDATARANIAFILQVCQGKVSARAPDTERRPIKGPMPTPDAYAATAQHYDDDDDDSDDEEGPLPAGARAKGPLLSPELIQAKAAQRARELQGVKGGLAAGDIPPEGQGREEWMLVPGKFDFLSAIKSGNPMRNRNFEAKSKADGGPDESQKPVDPKIQAEMDAIMQAHGDARGVSLVDQHRQDKAVKEKASGDDKSWKWNRDKDLDSGRRVDKNALNIVFGGAADNLNKKFQGGFSGR